MMLHGFFFGFALSFAGFFDVCTLFSGKKVMMLV
jgi:hypothetical protein